MWSELQVGHAGQFITPRINHQNPECNILQPQSQFINDKYALLMLIRLFNEMNEWMNEWNDLFAICISMTTGAFKICHLRWLIKLKQ